MLGNIRIVLVNTSHPGNIGAAARAMKNMGLSQLVLVDPNDFPSYEAYGRAAGADDVLGEAKVVSTLSEAIQDCVWVAGTSARSRTVQWPAYDARECAQRCAEEIAHGSVAIVFGCERTGLSNQELEHCHALVHIPTNEEYSSLNVASAVQVIAYELRMVALQHVELERQVKKDEMDRPARAEQLESMYQHFYQTMNDIGFLGTSNPEIIMRRIKNLFNRSQVTQREVNILRGILSAAQGRKSARKE